jgi:hypothetical protein
MIGSIGPELTDRVLAGYRVDNVGTECGYRAFNAKKGFAYSSWKRQSAPAGGNRCRGGWYYRGGCAARAAAATAAWTRPPTAASSAPTPDSPARPTCHAPHPPAPGHVSGWRRMT